MQFNKSTRVHVKRKGKSKKWRAEKRRRAELEQKRRKEARDSRREGLGFVSIEGATAEARFYERQEIFEARFGRLGGLVHTAAWLTHNCVAHPMLGLAPFGIWFDLHESTAEDMRVQGWV